MLKKSNIFRSESVVDSEGNVIIACVVLILKNDQCRGSIHGKCCTYNEL